MRLRAIYPYSLASSLSRAVGGRIGLTEGEIIEFLTAPNRKPDEFLIALEKLREQAWYLHKEDQRFFVKETENLSRQIERNAKDIPQPKIDQALVNKLTGILQPQNKKAYQVLQVLPRLDDIKLSGPRVLVVVRPDGTTPPQELTNYFEFQQEKNNLLVLSGEHSHMADAVEERLRELYAIEQIFKKLKPGDSLYEEAKERLEDADERFSKTIAGAYNRLYFPGFDELDGTDTLLKTTIDNGLKMGEAEHSAEQQIETLLNSPRANYKLVLDLQKSLQESWAQAEVELWQGGARRTPWKDVMMRSRTNPAWPWMPGASGMDTLKAEALKQGRWRMGEDGYIEKGPFPKEKTSINVQTQNVNTATGESQLSLTPRNGGPSPVVYYSTSTSVSEKDPQVDDLENFATKEATLYFLVADSTGKYETGDAQRWTAELKIRHEIHAVADKRFVELRCTPEAELYYTLDGSNPKDGTKYEEQFEVGAQPCRLLVFGKAGDATKSDDFQIPGTGDKRPVIDDTKPAKISDNKRVTLDSTDKVFGVLNKFKDRENVKLKGVRVEIGEGENTVMVRFHEREVTSAIIASTIENLRSILKEDQAPVTVTISSGIAFDNGFSAKEFAEISGIELKPGDVIQDV